MFAPKRVAATLILGSLLSACAHHSTPEDQARASSMSEVGSSFLRDQRYPEAIRAYEAAVRLHPEQANYSLNLGLAYLRSNRLEDAQKWTQKACALGTLPTECALQQATLLLLKGELPQALQWVEKAVDDPRYTSPAEAHLLKGRIHHGLKQYEDAQKAFAQASQILPRDCQPHLLMSQSLLAQAKFGEALHHAAIGVSMCASQEKAHEWEAYVLYRLGRIAAAKKKYGQIMTLFRKSETVERNRQALIRLGNEEILEEPEL